MRRAGRPLILSLLVASLVLATFVWPAGQARAAKPAKPQPPNILFIIMDDVGIDQFEKTFGVGAEDAAPTPAMDTLATGGLRFRNVWAMAECSPSRALMLTGRYPLRTHVYAPLQPVDLANSQVSPYETTVPKVLKHAGYASALFGKHHVGGADNYPNGDQSPALFGFDYFHGPMGGKTAGAKPDPIGTTAGIPPPNSISRRRMPTTSGVSGRPIRKTT
jgi:arylsulfatase A-like enzyme